MIHYKKAQAAMEFLMTYGWAILIVLIAIIAISYFVAVGRAFFLPERCVIPPDSGLFCEDFVAYPGIVILKVKNAFPDSIEITNASISQNEKSCNLTTTLTIPSSSSNNLALTGGPTCFNLTEYGKRIKGDIFITYKKRYLLRTTIGDMIVKVMEAGAFICKNADKNDLCKGLDYTFGVGYREACCKYHRLCCP